jgi:hypothetical protein
MAAWAYVHVFGSMQSYGDVGRNFACAHTFSCAQTNGHHAICFTALAHCHSSKAWYLDLDKSLFLEGSIIWWWWDTGGRRRRAFCSQTFIVFKHTCPGAQPRVKAGVAPGKTCVCKKRKLAVFMWISSEKEKEPGNSQVGVILHKGALQWRYVWCQHGPLPENEDAVITNDAAMMAARYVLWLAGVCCHNGMLLVILLSQTCARLKRHACRLETESKYYRPLYIVYDTPLAPLYAKLPNFPQDLFFFWRTQIQPQQAGEKWVWVWVPRRFAEGWALINAHSSAIGVDGPDIEAKNDTCSLNK